MQANPSEPGRSRHAITDLFDEDRGTFLISYPTWLVIGIILTGVLAAALTGFLGYTAAQAAVVKQAPDTGITLAVFQQAWLLFLWLCAVLITVQISIFRDASLRKRLVASLIISLLAVIFIGITYFNKSLPNILQQLLQGHRFITLLAGHAGTYAIVNFGLLAVFWLDTLRRWARRARGHAPALAVDIGLDQPRSKSALPSLQELISGDLIAGAILSLILAGVFWFQFLPSLIHPQGVAITQCTLSWPFGACGVGATALDPPTLTFMDLIQTLIYLPLGLLLLAIASTLSGFGAVGGVEDKTLRDLDIEPVSVGRAGTVPIAEDVAATILNTLKSALDRRARSVASNLALSLRSVGWPALIVVAIYGLAEFASGLQNYLHSPKHLADGSTFLLPAASWGIAAVLGFVFSAALMLFRWRVAANTLRFLGLIGFILLLTLWIFSLAMWGFNELLLLTNATVRHPFDPPSISTAISFAALLLFGLILLLRQVRQGPVGSRAPAAASAVPNRYGDPAATSIMQSPRTPES